MIDSIYFGRWLIFRNRYRSIFSLFLVMTPFFGLSLFYMADSLSKDAFLAVMAASIIFGGNFVSFLYDKPLFLGGAVYSEDGTIGRYLFSVIELILFFSAQFIPFII